jgi:hypothetical protein
MNDAFESRLLLLEQRVEDLERRLTSDPSKENWLSHVLGTFENEPDFAEVLKHGREYRKSMDQDEHGNGS